MKRLQSLSALFLGIVLGYSTLSPAFLNPSEQVPRVESKSTEKTEALEDWDVYRGIRSAQTIEQVADMLSQYYHSLPRFTAPIIPSDTPEEMVDRPLDVIIFQWTKEFCVLNQWPLDDCGPIVDKRLHELIQNSV